MTLADAHFDLIACATAFHWLNAVPALAKARRSLKPGGCVALIWNVLQDLEKDDAFHNATATLLSPLATSPSGAPDSLPYALNVKARELDAKTAGFKSTVYIESKWTFTVTTKQVVRLYEGFSQIQRADIATREHVLSKLQQIADEQFGGRVDRNVTSCLYLIR